MKTLALLLFSATLLPAKAATQKVNLPCELPKLAVAGDGSGVWFVCSRNWAAIRKAQDVGQPPPASYQNHSDVYWIDTATAIPEKIADADTQITVIAAPSGSQSLFVVAQKSGAGRVLLYNRKQRVKELPIDPSFLLWAGDSQRIYFYGGTTIQADAWDILGIYDLSKGTITQAKLREPTEILRVCPAAARYTPQLLNIRTS